ncbi:MAG: hypothetical protein L3J39_12820 [Verrucomicrobiales bacterium]|nr:hypothetical protein [Verrucomicrobiales bacterium]
MKISNRMMKVMAGFCWVLGFASVGSFSLQAASMNLVGVDAKLVSEAKTIVPGQTFTVALSLKHKDEYHTYWKNPGTVGVATMLNWDLPEGFTAGEVQWQVPERVTMVIYNTHGYAKDTWLLVDITAPKKLPAGSYTFKARAAWMTCAEKNCCNVAFQDLQLKLQAGDKKEWNDEVRSEITAAREKLPKAIKGWEVTASRSGAKITLRVKSEKGLPVDLDDALYFYSALSYVDTTVPQKVSIKDGELSVVFQINELSLEKKIETVEGLLYNPNAWPGSPGQKYMPLEVSLQ